MGAVREAVEEVQAAEQRGVLIRALKFCFLGHTQPKDRDWSEVAHTLLNALQNQGYVLVKASDLPRDVEYGPRGAARVKKLEARIKRAFAALAGEDE